MGPTWIRSSIAVAVVFGVALLPSVPGGADTSSEIRARKARLEVLQRDLDRLVSRYEEVQEQQAQTEARLESLRIEVGALQERMEGLRDRLSERASEAYQSGGSSMLQVLLDSRSATEFTDRAQFLGQIAQEDAELLQEATVTSEQLRRLEVDLVAAAAEQSQTVVRLEDHRRAIAANLAETRRIIDRLEERQAREKAAAAAAERARQAAIRAGGGATSFSSTGGGSVPATGTGNVAVCPVGQPHSFVNTFGAPRSGGRSHQGIDIMAPYGTPVYATHGGSVRRSYNSLGGLTVIVTAPNGTYTYYAHLSSYSGSGSVSTGSMIGRVGDTGNAPPGVYHLHYEYHPSGGGAVNPYYSLLRVC